MSTKLVPRIKEVTVHINKIAPPVLVVNAVGEVNSGGHTNPKLEPRIYVKPPQDGIWEYDFTVDEPSGPSTTAVEEITAPTHEWADFPETDIKGVKVYGGEEPKTVMISDLDSSL